MSPQNKNKRNMKKDIIYIMSGVALLSGCGIYTTYQPQTDVPGNICGNIDTLVACNGYGEQEDGNAMATDGDTAVAGVLDWRALFSDTKLQALIEKGLLQNTDLLSAEQRVKEAEATLLSSRLAFLPSFALSPQGGVSSFDGSKGAWAYSLPVTASWEIDIFGRMRNAKLQAKALLAQSRDYKQAVRTQLIASIANTYYTLVMLDEQLYISRQTATAWEETVSATRAMMKAGQSNEAAVSQMEASLSGVRTSILDLEEQINQAENSLSLLLAETPQKHGRNSVNAGLGHSGQPQGGGNGACSITATRLLSGIPLQLIRNRPDVRSAERGLEAAFYGVNQARSAFYPQITLGGSAGWSNSAGSVIVNPAKFLAEAIGSLTMPIFNRGQNVAQLKIAKAQQEESRLSFRQTILNAGSEVNDALTAYQTASSKAQHYEQQIESLESALRSTKLLMQYGTTTYLEVLTAQQSLLSARLQQSANRFACVQSVITLYQALGGGQE